MAGLTPDDIKLGGRRRPAIEMPKKKTKNPWEKNS
jgi:hypothetical protein